MANTADASIANDAKEVSRVLSPLARPSRVCLVALHFAHSLPQMSPEGLHVSWMFVE